MSDKDRERTEPNEDKEIFLFLCLVVFIFVLTNIDKCSPCYRNYESTERTIKNKSNRVHVLGSFQNSVKSMGLLRHPALSSLSMAKN